MFCRCCTNCQGCATHDRTHAKPRMTRQGLRVRCGRSVNLPGGKLAKAVFLRVMYGDQVDALNAKHPHAVEAPLAP